MSDYWTENNLIKPQSIIVCAAIWKNGYIICGARHWDTLMHEQADTSRIDYSNAEQGFIDQFGDFYNRKEAMAIVKRSGQPFNAGRNGGDTVLFSEGLY